MQEINQEEDQLFPEDPEAPKVEEKKSFFKRYQNLIEILIFSLISLSTIITVSFSIYIIIIKYF